MLLKKCTGRKSLTLLLAAVYMISYLTRINFGAVISEMVSSTGFSQSLLSLSLTGSFITYGIGQIISGVLGDLVSPKKLVTVGFITTAVMNFTIPFCPNPYYMIVIWCLNGFAQSLMWPPMVKIMTAHLSEEEYKKSVTKVSWGGSIGTIAVYLLAPLLITLCGWRWVFFTSSVFGAAMLFIWIFLAPDEARKERHFSKSRSSRSLQGFVFTADAGHYGGDHFSGNSPRRRYHVDALVPCANLRPE